MPRKPRLALAGYPHHVVQRGNDRQSIFRDDLDRRRYLELLADHAGRQKVEVHAYVLMPNHVHLLMTPADDRGLSGLMQALGRSYVRWFNDRHQRSGSLWEGRFFSSLIEADRYLLACYRYIELNPVRAGMVSDPAEYVWSSHAYHIGLRADHVVSDHSLFWVLGNTPFERQTAYRAMFGAVPQAGELEGIRTSIRRNQALASADFSQSAGIRPLHLPSSRRPGRPRS